MKKLFVLLGLIVSMTVPPISARCEQLPTLSGFKQPIARCLKPSGNLIITQVGSYQESPDGTPPLEIVASVQPDTDPNVITEFDHAAINIYGPGCHLIYRQEFSGSGEVTFETIHLGDQTLLHLIAMSAVDEPTDDVIYGHILLAGYGGSFFPVQPPFLQSDKNVSIFIGDIGGGRGPGIVETFRPWPAPPHFSPISVMFQLKNVALPQGQTLTTFVGPTVIRPPLHKNSLDAWPDTSYATGFPLMHYLYGKWGGG